MRVGELAAEVGLTPAAIRFYERCGVLRRANRTSSGYRDYPASAVEELRFVRAGQAIGFTLTELAEIAAIRDGGEEPCHELVALMERRLHEVDERIHELNNLRAQLADLTDAARSIDVSDCTSATMYALVQPKA